MIIPIVFRGRPEALPSEIRDHIHFMDSRGFTLYDARIRRNRQYVEGIERIAEYISELYSLCLRGRRRHRRLQRVPAARGEPSA